jgi:hypothetical protein
LGHPTETFTHMTDAYAKNGRDIAAASDRFAALNEQLRGEPKNHVEAASEQVAKELAAKHPDHFAVGKKLSSDGSREYAVPVAANAPPTPTQPAGGPAKDPPESPAPVVNGSQLEPAAPLTAGAIADRLSAERAAATGPGPLPGGPRSVLDAHKAATGPARDLLESALWNSGYLAGDASAPTRTKRPPADALPRLVEGLAHAHEVAHKSGDAAALRAVTEAMAHVEAEPAHAPGDAVPFDGAMYHGPAGVFTGDPARVVVPAVVRAGKVVRKGEAVPHAAKKS